MLSRIVSSKRRYFQKTHFRWKSQKSCIMLYFPQKVDYSRYRVILKLFFVIFNSVYWIITFGCKGWPFPRYVSDLSINVSALDVYRLIWLTCNLVPRDFPLKGKSPGNEVGLTYLVCHLLSSHRWSARAWRQEIGWTPLNLGMSALLWSASWKTCQPLIHKLVSYTRRECARLTVQVCRYKNWLSVLIREYSVIERVHVVAHFHWNTRRGSLLFLTNEKVTRTTGSTTKIVTLLWRKNDLTHNIYTVRNINWDASISLLRVRYCLFLYCRLQ